MPEQSILIDRDLRPAYYDGFHCLAERCKISCCKGWRVTYGKKDYLSLKRQAGSPDLNGRLEGGVCRVRGGQARERFYGEFRMKGGVCPLLREDGLCQLQREKGHEALPFVCRSYPRGEAYLPSGYLERSLSPSCEGVLSLLWDLPEGIEFRSDPLPRERCKRFTSTNTFFMWFPVVRGWCVDLLQNRQYPLHQRIWLIGLRLKELADGETDIGQWVERAAVLPDSGEVSAVLPGEDRELAMYLSCCVHTLMGLQTNDPELRPAAEAVMESLRLESDRATGNITIPLGPYEAARARYEERFGGREYFMENLMVAIFFHLTMPHMASREALWKGYVNFCNLYAIYRFLAVMSCREGAPGDREELFRLMVLASRALLHNGERQNQLRDELFKNDSATLAHMAILLR